MTDERATETEVAAKAAAAWNRASESGRTARTRWWLEPTIVRHVNKRICGRPLDGVGAGLSQWALDVLPDLPRRQAVSIGGGSGVKEMRLLELGIVEHVDVFEIASTRVAQGRKIAADRGLTERITFHERLLRSDECAGRYDIVHWNNSLHHMLDVDEWLGWSRRALRPDGVLLMDDFVGPSRFQWTTRQCRIASRYRRTLPDALLIDPADPSKKLDRRIRPPSIESMIASDPTEAADSSRITESLRRHFPAVEIRFTGGAIYNLALQDVMANMDPDRDSGMLRQALIMDDLLSGMGENHYAAAIARAPNKVSRLVASTVRIGDGARQDVRRIGQLARHPRRTARALARRLA